MQANFTFDIESAGSSVTKDIHTAQNACRRDANVKAIKYGFHGPNDYDLVPPHYQGFGPQTSEAWTFSDK